MIPNNNYTVQLPVYAGPLDLLLQLIERDELDITKVALAQVTEQFLAHLKVLESLNLADIADFLVVAARLVLIKSEALLPRPVVRQPGEEDPADELARQLIAYKRYKEIAQLLHLQLVGGLHLLVQPVGRVEPPARAHQRHRVQRAPAVGAGLGAAPILGVAARAGLHQAAAAGRAHVRGGRVNFLAARAHYALQRVRRAAIAADHRAFWVQLQPGAFAIAARLLGELHGAPPAGRGSSSRYKKPFMLISVRGW